MKNRFNRLASAIDKRLEKSADVVYPQGRILADDLLEQQKIEDLYDFFIQQKINELKNPPAPIQPSPTIRQRMRNWWNNSDTAEFLRTLPEVAIDPSGFVARQVQSNPAVAKDTLENLKRIGTRTMSALGRFGTNLGHYTEMGLDPKLLPRMAWDENYRKKYKSDWKAQNDKIRNYWQGLEGTYDDESLNHGINQALVNTAANTAAAAGTATFGSALNAAVEPVIAAKAAPLIQKLGPVARKFPKLAKLIKNYGTAGREFMGLRPGYMATAPLYMNMLEDQVYGLPGDNYAPYTEQPTAENPNPQHRSGLPIRGTLNILPGMGVPARIAGLANDWINNKPFNTFDYQKNPTINDHGGAADQGFLNSMMMSINANPFVDLVDSYLEGQKNRGMGGQDAAMTQLSDAARLLPGKWGKVLGAVGAVGEQAYPTLRDMGVPSPWTYARTLPQRREMKRNAAEVKRIWDEYNRIARENDFEGRFKQDIARLNGETPPHVNNPIVNPEIKPTSPATIGKEPEYRTSVSYSPQNVNRSGIPIIPWGANSNRNAVPTGTLITVR